MSLLLFYTISMKHNTENGSGYDLSYYFSLPISSLVSECI
jgi:hypothetical protein